MTTYIFDKNYPPYQAEVVSDKLRNNFNALARANDFQLIETTPPSLSVVYNSGIVYFNNQFKEIQSGTLSGFVLPSSSGNKKIVLVYLANDFTVKYVESQESTTPTIPDLPTDAIFPIANFELDFSTVNIKSTDINDMRIPFMISILSISEQKELTSGQSTLLHNHNSLYYLRSDVDGFINNIDSEISEIGKRLYGSVSVTGTNSVYETVELNFPAGFFNSVLSINLTLSLPNNLSSNNKYIAYIDADNNGPILDETGARIKIFNTAGTTWNDSVTLYWEAIGT